MKYLLIGYGNPLRSDDGVGCYVAGLFHDDAAALMGAAAADLHVVSVPQLVPELAELFAQSEIVVLVDASHGELPGELKVRRVEPAKEAAEPMIHAYDPSTLAAWAGQLYGNCPEIYVVAVGAENFGFGEGLSPEVTETVPAVIEQVRDLFLNESKA
ncbi:MAG: hydrogenase maturation protease [Rhodospirillales bacterium]|nr:hydrogenase maturation protease [Rhodospirillales bacterium]